MTENNDDHSRIDEYINWPQEFYVCKKHKQECFAEYALAIVQGEEHCVICHPTESDSLGG